MIRIEPRDHILHDIRNALTSIRLTAEALGNGKDELTRHHSERMLRAVDQCTAICETQLRTFAAAGMPAEADAVVIATEVAQDLTELGRDHLRVFLESPGGALFVCCEPQALRRILTNLLDNARTALSTHAKPAIRVRLKADGKFVVIDVIDNAGGLPDGGKGYGGGTGLRIGPDGFVHGLGARSTKMLSSMYGGRMLVAETGPGGTQMRVILPAARSRVENTINESNCHS